MDGVTRISGTLLFSLVDFEDEVVGSPDDDFGNCRCDLDLEPLGNNLFRVPEPTSLTPFGPFGPMLSIGQIIEVELVEAQAWRYVRTQYKPEVWSGTLSRATRDMIENPPVRSLLDKLQAAGFFWEWSAGIITLQTELPHPFSANIQTLLDDLAQRVSNSQGSDRRE